LTLTRETGVAKQSLYDTFGDTSPLSQSDGLLSRGNELLHALSVEVRSNREKKIYRSFRGPDCGIEGGARARLLAVERQHGAGRGQDPGALSKFFVVTLQGMRAMARLKSDRRALGKLPGLR
jgi:hypothetical protein